MIRSLIHHLTTMTEGKKKSILTIFFFVFSFTIPFTNNSTAMPIPQLQARGTVLINDHGITSAELNNTDESSISSRVGSNDQRMKGHSIRQYGDGRLMREVYNSTSPPPAGDFGFTISAAPLSTSSDQSSNNSTAIPQLHRRQTGLVDGHGISSSGLNNTGETLISSRVGSPNESLDHSGGRKLLWVLTPAVLSPENFGEGSPNRNNMTGSNSQSTDHPIRQHVKRTMRESPSAAAPPPPDLGENAPYWNHEKRGQNKTGE